MVLGVFLSLFALMSLLERKILARIQNRYGPEIASGRTGCCSQWPTAIKNVDQRGHRAVSRGQDRAFSSPPIMIAAPAILALGVIPYGRNMTPFAIDGGILFFLRRRIGRGTRRLHGRLGQQQQILRCWVRWRAIAQMVSYELPLIITVLPGSDGLFGLALAPMRSWPRKAATVFGVIPHWFRHDAVGRDRLPFVFRFWSRRIKPHSIRRAGGRIRDRRGAHDGIFRGSSYATFFMAEYFGMFRHQRFWRWTLFSRWFGNGPDRVVAVHSVLRLVFCKTGDHCFSSSFGFGGTLPRVSD